MKKPQFSTRLNSLGVLRTPTDHERACPPQGSLFHPVAAIITALATRAINQPSQPRAMNPNPVAATRWDKGPSTRPKPQVADLGITRQLPGELNPSRIRHMEQVRQALRLRHKVHLWANYHIHTRTWRVYRMLSVLRLLRELGIEVSDLDTELEAAAYGTCDPAPANN